MSTIFDTEGPPRLAELLDRLGGITPARIVSDPAPGTATEADLLALMRRKKSLYELIDGTIVEKAMGFRESSVGADLIIFIGNYLLTNDLGVLTGEAGALKLFAGLVRVPDISFFRWEKFPGRRIPSDPLPQLAPDLAVEVLSKSNTKAEMQRKMKDLFLAGTTLVWLVDPEKRTVAVHTAPDKRTVLTEKEVLDGGTVLPGFSLEVQRIFARLPDVEDDKPGKTPGKKPKKS